MLGGLGDMIDLGELVRRAVKYLVEGMLLAFNVLFGAILLGEKVTWNIILGVVLIVSGTYVCYMK